MAATRTRSPKTQREKLPEARTKIWSAIRFLKKFDFEELEQTTGQSYPHIRRYVKRLLDAGYLRLATQAKAGQGCNRYRLIRDTGPLPPMPRRNRTEVYDPNTQEVFVEAVKLTGRDLGWALMREGKPFTSFDLTTVAKMQRANALKYLAGLLEAGYVQQIRAAVPGVVGGAAVYRLLMDTGELAPIVQRSGSVFDPNLEKEEGDGLD